MTFTQRLWRYMIGVFVGTLLAFFFFGTRSCSSWLPNEQVRKFLGEPGLMGDERTRCLMRCGAVDMSRLRASSKRAASDMVRATSAMSRAPASTTALKTKPVC